MPEASINQTDLPINKAAVIVLNNFIQHHKSRIILRSGGSLSALLDFAGNENYEGGIVCPVSRFQSVESHELRHLPTNIRID